MQELIASFYQAFDALDAEAMATCYHEDILFEDPAFGRLEGARASHMWRMLCASQQGKDFSVSATNIEVEGDQGRARWEARYAFQGRPVHNIVDAEFTFAEGKIVRHIDRFDLHRWARQAIGPMGLLIGWTPYFRKRLQAQTNARLDRYMQRKR